MAARRQRNRQRRRRGRFGVLYKLFSFLLVFAAILVGCVVFFRVNQVEVVGNSRYSPEEIIDASGVEVGENLFLVNRPRTNTNLIQRLPYIQKASMVRRLPDTIELHVTESDAAAFVEIGGVRWVIDSRGKFLESLGPEDASLGESVPQLLGLTPEEPSVGGMMSVSMEEQPALKEFRGLLDALSARNMADKMTDFIDVSTPSVIYFGYGGELTVAVPAIDDLDWYAFALRQVMDKFAQRGERVTGTLYLTYGEERASLLTERWFPEGYRTKGEVSDGTDSGADDGAENGADGIGDNGDGGGNEDAVEPPGVSEG